MGKAKDIKGTILGISIAIVFALFIGFGISTFFDSPEREDFCQGQYKPIITSEDECLKIGGKWEATPIKLENSTESSGYCNAEYTCEEDFKVAREKYNRIVFIISTIIGLAAVLLGGIILTLPSVSSGLMGGGVITIIYGTIRYWGNLADIGRFILLGLVLGVLIWIGYKKLKR